jgi:hypothetical protein
MDEGVMPAIVIFRLLLALSALALGFCGVAAIAEPALIAERMGLGAPGLITAAGLVAMALALVGILMAHREYA